MSITREILAKYITPGCLFIESGTRWGDTCIRAIELHATLAVTVECDELMAYVAKQHCSDFMGSRWTAGSIVVIHGDSSKVFSTHPNLKDFVGVYEDIVVWLDAHTESSTPILGELDAIRKWKNLPQTILIDDMHLMASWEIRDMEIAVRLKEMGYTKFDTENEGKILVAQR